MDAKVGADGDSKPTTAAVAAADAKDAAASIATSAAEEENPNHRDAVEQEQDHESPVAPPRQSSRTPFTNLSQVDADLALARTLQEQERAYMMLRMNGGEGSDYGSWESGSYAHDDEDDFNDPNNANYADESQDEVYDGTDEDDEADAFDVHAHADTDSEEDINLSSGELDPSAYSSDEAYARALQDAEDREMAARLLALAGINDREVEAIEDHGRNSQDTWEEVDPDEFSYEELLALGEAVGTESRGLSAEKIASLPSANYKTSSSSGGTSDSCVICRLDYEDGDALTVLYCKHSYHADCLNNWLRINKVCPVCSTEVSVSETC